jgi:ABC-2 type transport system permease protein
MMLFGCAYYPWSALSAIGPVQYLFLLNPLVFISEAVRKAVTPEVPHMPLVLLLPGLALFTLGLGWLGARAFVRRVIL